MVKVKNKATEYVYKLCIKCLNIMKIKQMSKTG